MAAMIERLFRVLAARRKHVGTCLVALVVWAAGAEAASAADDALSHVMDSSEWHFFTTFEPKHIYLPKIFGFQITKFMVLQLIAAGLIMAIFIPLARRAARGDYPKGAWWNSFEVLLTFVRDQIAKPALDSGNEEHHGEHHDAAHGHHAQHKPAIPEYDRYVPFLWTMFLFILFNNLLGMVPFGASATASIYVTAALALVVFFAIHGAAVARMGVGKYIGSIWPNLDLPGPLRLGIGALVFVIEIVGIIVRNAVLAVRLFANMFAGHMVLATILLFIVVAGRTAFALWAAITLSSVLGIVALSLLELFVAFLQAYIFTFLTALFMGMALHPQH